MERVVPWLRISESAWSFSWIECGLGSWVDINKVRSNPSKVIPSYNIVPLPRPPLITTHESGQLNQAPT